MKKKCSTGQWFIGKQVTSYKIHILAYLVSTKYDLLKSIGSPLNLISKLWWSLSILWRRKVKPIAYTIVKNLRHCTMPISSILIGAFKTFSFTYQIIRTSIVIIVLEILANSLMHKIQFTKFILSKGPKIFLHATRSISGPLCMIIISMEKDKS